jgi:hypothetical protein
MRVQEVFIAAWQRLASLRDALSVWHLLSRTKGERGRVFDRLAAVTCLHRQAFRARAFSPAIAACWMLVGIARPRFGKLVEDVAGALGQMITR